MKVHKFTLSGKELPFYFGIDTVEEVMKSMEGEVSSKNVIPQMKKAFTASLRHGHKKEGIEFKLTPPKISELIDDNPKALMDIWKLYNEEASIFFDAVMDGEKK